MEINLQSIRKRRKLSQSDVANALGVKLRTYGSWERGEAMLNLEQAFNCAVVLNCTIDEIAGLPDRTTEYRDDRKNDLVRYYDSMNESGKTLLVESAKSISADPERRIIKDRQEYLDDTGAIGA